MTTKTRLYSPSVELRAESLADKFNLSLQLTTIWVNENRAASTFPMSRQNLAKLKAWAKLPADHDA